MEYKKVEVDVICKHTKDGKTKPLVMHIDDGEKYLIDNCLCCERAASTKVGGCGLRYTVQIEGKLSYLFEDDGVWYVEERCD